MVQKLHVSVEGETIILWIACLNVMFAVVVEYVTPVQLPIRIVEPKTAVDQNRVSETYFGQL